MAKTRRPQDIFVLPMGAVSVTADMRRANELGDQFSHPGADTLTTKSPAMAVCTTQRADRR